MVVPEERDNVTVRTTFVVETWEDGIILSNVRLERATSPLRVRFCQVFGAHFIAKTIIFYSLHLQIFITFNFLYQL
jgi:hypothetical protein